MSARINDADQLALLEPCPVCQRLAPGPSSGLTLWGGPGYHEWCLVALRRWYPDAVMRVETVRIDAELTANEATR